MKTPEDISAPDLTRALAANHNCIIAGTRFDDLKDRLIRIGTMGWVTDADVATDLEQIAEEVGRLRR